MRSAHPVELLTRVKRRLETVLKIPDDYCFIAEDARDLFPPTMPDRAFIITFEGSSFNSDGDQTSALMIETCYFDVTCYNRLAALDENSRAVSLVSNYEVNLFEMKRRALVALVGWRFDVPEMENLEIASTTKATRCGKAEFLSTADGAVHAAFLPLTFSVALSLDLCSEEYNV